MVLRTKMPKTELPNREQCFDDIKLPYSERSKVYYARDIFDSVIYFSTVFDQQGLPNSDRIHKNLTLAVIEYAKKDNVFENSYFLNFLKRLSRLSPLETWDIFKDMVCKSVGDMRFIINTDYNLFDRDVTNALLYILEPEESSDSLGEIDHIYRFDDHYNSAIVSVISSTTYMQEKRREHVKKNVLSNLKDPEIRDVIDLGKLLRKYINNGIGS